MTVNYSLSKERIHEQRAGLSTVIPITKSTNCNMYHRCQMVSCVHIFLNLYMVVMLIPNQSHTMIMTRTVNGTGHRVRVRVGRESG